MKQTESMLLAFWVLFLLLKGVEYTGGDEYFSLMTFVLCLFYCFGAFRLFNVKSDSPLVVRIFAGISLAIALFTLPFTINLRNLDWPLNFTYFHAICTTILGGFVGVKKWRKDRVGKDVQAILLRMIITLVITGFFASRWSSNPIYRDIIIYLNASNPDLISNMRMRDFNEIAVEHLANGNCDQAIEYSIRAFEEGLNWLWIEGDSLNDKDIDQLWKIQGLYTDVYKAYDCKAARLYDNHEYEEALFYQLKADSFLTINPIARDLDWEKVRVTSKNKIGLCYHELSLYDSASSNYIKAIQYHYDHIGEFNKSVAVIFNNLAESLGNNRVWMESSQIAKRGLLILDQDSITEDKSEEYKRAYFQLIFNALSNNQLKEAKYYLELVKSYLLPKDACKYHLYNSALALSLAQITALLQHAEMAKDCNIEHFGADHQNVAESFAMLYEGWIRLPNYDSALVALRQGMEITEANYGRLSLRYHNFIRREADYFYAIGDYGASLKGFSSVEKVYRQELGEEADKLPQVLASIGRVKVELGDVDEALKYGNESFNLSEKLLYFEDNRAASILNDIAYINYATGQLRVADELYTKSVDLNVAANRDSSIEVASALNGLGLIAMQKAQLERADSLFKQSMKLYKLQFSDKHPSTGVIFMNQSELDLKRGNFDRAHELIEDALENFIPFNRKDHPTIGDMYRLKSDIQQQRRELNDSEELLRRALEIYESNFSITHWKVKAARNRLIKLN